ncbi:MAG: hypothetical protein NC110_07120 [Ruminococcus sp.]|nr:hypothetical protein [Ruminococcus sp.]
MTLFYEGSDGTVIDLMNNGIYAQSPETLVNSSWSYSHISGVNGIVKIKRFYKDIQEAKLDVSIMADSEDEFNQMMYKMHQTFDRDVRRMKPGKLWWNGYYKEVFAVETSHSEFEEFFEAVEKTITFLSVYSYWVKEHTYQYLSHIGNSGNLDYGSMDYGDLDYNSVDFIEIVPNNCIENANFEITFYGPTIDPTVKIGEHEYSLNTELQTGEYAVVNSITKKITKYSNIGEAENIFHLRNRDSYIFEKIPEGNIAVVRSKEISLSIKIFDERGEPEWI